ncbi:MAG: cysteine desulfurase, partial [Anaerolineae bacterium]|nr:cysteine desulfurase [Anaerolineae bacterium]
DYAASTPVDPQVLNAMLPFFSEIYGNPSSVHQFGQASDAAIDQARETTARLMNARSDEITFTGCGTESDNLALRGVAWAQRSKRDARRILISPVEHHAVLHTAQQLVDQGFFLDYLEVDEYGMVDPDDVRVSIRPDTALVSVIYANNEIGTINPVSEIGAVCRSAGVPFHTDAVQAAAHLPVDVLADQVDLVSIGAHKFYGPKGVGALVVRKGVSIVPVQTGGKQEEGLRGGTSNTPLIVGLGTAFQLARESMVERRIRNLAMRDVFIEQVLSRIPKSRLTGHPSLRLPNHASFVFDGVDGNRLLMMLDVAGYACSSGSACKTGNPQPSEVLSAIGLNRSWALGSLRVTFGRTTTAQILSNFVDVLVETVERIRQ